MVLRINLWFLYRIDFLIRQEMTRMALHHHVVLIAGLKDRSIVLMEIVLDIRRKLSRIYHDSLIILQALVMIRNVAICRRNRDLLI